MIVNSNTLRDLRQDMLLSQTKMAERLGVSRSYYNTVEGGKRPFTDDFKKKIELLEQEFKSQRDQDSKKLTEQRAVAKKSFTWQEDKERFQRELRDERKSQEFIPKVEPKIDMIWLRNVLGPGKPKEFEEYMQTLMLNDMAIEHCTGDGTKSGRFQWNLHGKDGNIHVGYKFYKNGVLTNELLIQFNPNKVKWDNEYLIKLMYFLGDNPNVRKFDVCKDYVGVDTGHVIMFDNARREIKTIIGKGDNPSITYYIGDMNANGCRLYNKKAELREKDNLDIAYECARLEHRCKLPKALELDKLPRVEVTTLFPIFHCINKDLTELDDLYEIDMEIYCIMVMILEGRVYLPQFSRRKQEKLRELLDHKKTEALTLTQFDIRLALLDFVSNYNFNYNMHHVDIFKLM